MKSLSFYKLFRIFGIFFCVAILVGFGTIIATNVHTVTGAIIVSLLACVFLAIPGFMVYRSNKTIRLLETGREAKLVIKELRGVNRQKREKGPDVYYATLLMEVQVQGQSPYELEKALGFYQSDIKFLVEGAILPAMVDRDDQMNIKLLEFEWRKSRR